MRETLVVRREQHIPAPPAVVFTVLTDEPGALSSLGGLKLRLSSSRRETEFLRTLRWSGLDSKLMVPGLSETFYTPPEP